MGLASVLDVRTFGKLPEAAKLDDSVIQPHLESAVRELTGWIGDYSASTGDKAAACIEAESCICMNYLLPVLNTFYTEGLAAVQKEMGELDLVFHSVSDLERLQAYWMRRARTRVKPFETSGGDKMYWGAV